MTDIERIKKLFPRIFLACKDNDLAIEELKALLGHLDLLQQLNTECRLRKT